MVFRVALSCNSFFFSSRRRHTRYIGDWSSDVCSSDLTDPERARVRRPVPRPRGGGLARSGSVAAGAAQPADHCAAQRSEERREGKSVDLGGVRLIQKKKQPRERRKCIFTARYGYKVVL